MDYPEALKTGMLGGKRIEYRHLVHPAQDEFNAANT
jgi:hypothetical protein